MSEAEKEARRWFRYAREDMHTAGALVAQSEFAPRHACFLAQQAAEKALKCVLVFLQIEFPYTHDLDRLRNLIPKGWSVKRRHPHLATLTEWAVEARYPGEMEEATVENAQDAVAEARALLKTVREDLAHRGLQLEPLS